jgi:soluble cytochrome b562
MTDNESKANETKTSYDNYINECNQYFEELQKNIEKTKKKNKSACVRARTNCMDIIKLMKEMRVQLLDARKSIPIKKKEKKSVEESKQ